MESRANSRIANALLVVGTVFAMLIVAELFFRFLAPIPDPLAGAKSRDYPNQFIPSEFKPHMSLRTEAEPGLPGLSGQHMFTTNNVGLRGDSLAMPKPANEYRVFMIGGSTVECMYLDDTEAVTAVLQRGLGRTADGRVVKVYNAGKSGDRSDSHISMLVHRLVHLQPDLIVVMLGLNDLRISLAGFDFRHFDRRPAYTTAPAPPPLALHNFVVLAATEFQLGRRLYNLVVRATPRTARQVQETIALRSTARVAWEAAKKLRVSAREPHGDTAAFHRNVESLVGIAEGQEVPIVLVTQGSTWASPDTLNRWRWMWAVADSAYSEAGMKAGLDELNDVTRATARRHNVPLYDLARLIPPTGANYYDDAHFNVAGAALAGNELAKFIKGLDLPGLSRAVPAPAPAHRGEGAPR